MKKKDAAYILLLAFLIVAFIGAVYDNRIVFWSFIIMFCVWFVYWIRIEPREWAK
jgi:hypothetical protein